MQHNSIVIELNAAMAQLHKKCNFANFTLIFSFKLLTNSYHGNCESALRAGTTHLLCLRIQNVSPHMIYLLNNVTPLHVSGVAISR